MAIEGEPDMESERHTKCCERVSHDSWHFFPCKNAAKWIYSPPAGDDMPVCGVHARHYRKRYPERVRPTDMKGVVPNE